MVCSSLIGVLLYKSGVSVEWDYPLLALGVVVPLPGTLLCLKVNMLFDECLSL